MTYNNFYAFFIIIKCIIMEDTGSTYCELEIIV